MRLLIALLLFLVAAYYLSPFVSQKAKGKTAGTQRKSSSQQAKSAKAGQAIADRGELARCDQCSTFFPPSSALRLHSGSKDLLFCSEQCKRLHEQR